MTVQEHLESIGACQTAQDWAAGYSTAQDVWDLCDKSLWLLWWLSNVERDLYRDPYQAQRSRLTTIANNINAELTEAESAKGTVVVGTVGRVAFLDVDGYVSADAIRAVYPNPPWNEEMGNANIPNQ